MRHLFLLTLLFLVGVNVALSEEKYYTVSLFGIEVGKPFPKKPIIEDNDTVAQLNTFLAPMPVNHGFDIFDKYFVSINRQTKNVVDVSSSFAYETNTECNESIQRIISLMNKENRIKFKKRKNGNYISKSDDDRFALVIICNVNPGWPYYTLNIKLTDNKELEKVWRGGTF